MGIKSSKENVLHVIGFNYNIASTSFYAKRILLNYLDKFKNKNRIICIQGVRDESFSLEDDNTYYDKSLGLLTNSNLKLVEKKNEHFQYEKLIKINSLMYGFQYMKFEFDDIFLNVFNIELVPNQKNIINCEYIRCKQMSNLINFIAENNFGINIILGTFYDYKKSHYNNLIDVSQIKNFITNTNSNKGETYIFFHYKEAIKNLDNLKTYIFDNYKINITEQKIGDLEIENNLSFELVIKIKKK